MRLSCFLILALGCIPALHAQAPKPPENPGAISVIPNRVVLEGRDRSAEVMVKNSGNTKASFRISMVERSMTEAGRLEDRAKAPGETTAADLVRFTPRQVDLEPGASQIIRIQLRKPENLPDGEYRSHLLMQGIPPAAPAAPVEQDNQEKQISFSLTQVLGISIPVIVRQGDLSAEVALTHADPVFFQPEYEGVAPVISLWLERKGNRSLIGDMKVTLESGGDKPKGTVLWELKSVGIYTNLPRRRIYLGVPGAAGGKLKGAKAKVTFTPTDMKLAPVSTLVDLHF